MIAVWRIAKARVHETSFTIAGIGDHLKKSQSQYLMWQQVSQDTPRDHFIKEKTATSVSCIFFCCLSITLPLLTELPTLPPYSLEQECICYMYHVLRPHITTEESKFSSLYCLGHAFSSNQNISEALLQIPLCSHLIFPLNYYGLYVTAQFLWENSLCCISECKTDQIKGDRKGRKIKFRFFKMYNHSFWKDNWKQAIESKS